MRSKVEYGMTLWGSELFLSGDIFPACCRCFTSDFQTLQSLHAQMALSFLSVKS